MRRITTYVGRPFRAALRRADHLRSRLWWSAVASAKAEALPHRWRFTAFIACAALFALVLWVRLGPLPAGLLDPARDVSTVVVDRHGEVLYEARSGSGARRSLLAAKHLPPQLVAATIAAEDHRFAWHPGVDPIALVRAAARNIRAGRTVEGGSTITQQVAKLLLAAHEPHPVRRGLRAKVREALVAFRLEHRLSKNEILALYFNVAPYGNQIAGATRAAQLYFGVEPSILTPAQAAFLAALPQRPSAYNPYRDPSPALKRQRAILARMAEEGLLTQEQAAAARVERLRFVPLSAAFKAPHFVEMVLTSRSDFHRVRTTLDARLQADVQGIIRSHRALLDRHGAHNVAIVVLDNRTSEWRAWEGSGDYADVDHGGAINGPLMPRQPGSALKPFTYALGFETGETPASIVPDIPASFPTGQPGVVYTPRNYDGLFHGPLRIRKALAGSQNVPAVALASRIGVSDLLQFLRQAGFTTLDKTASHYGLGLTLGNAEVRLSELVSAYAALARGGVYIEPRTVFPDGGAERMAPVRRIVSPRAAYWVSDVLSDADARSYVFGRGGSLEFPFPVAAKTGTSQAYHDNWAVGYTREVTVGVWVGNFDRRPLVGSSGVTGAGPLFQAVMLAAQHRLGDTNKDASVPLIEPPRDLKGRSVCALSGMLAGAACPVRSREWLPGTFSEAPCDWHHASEDGLLTVWPPEYRRWAHAHGYSTDPSRTSGAESRPVPRVPSSRSRRQEFAIVSPAGGATYLLDPTLRAEFQSVPLRAVSGRGSIEWRVDGTLYTTNRDGVDVHWPLRRGQHRIAARNGQGEEAEVVIVVK
jgi:penicillin-binding protein 1C